MHKCINNSENDVSHLEQVTNEFFPYSQQQLGFDKPVTIIFQSDEENSSKMLGKTAFYNPDTFEVVLYTDNRHPKDILRSLSHELVHHNQNCRGDFTGTSQTVDGYAQSDPHLRKMEREAYTKGNLIFRDFEDLIKTGKINIEIDFSDSGEPKMSLKEWKNNEINTKLMKKWGLLKEDSRARERRNLTRNIGDDKGHIKNLKRDIRDDEEELEEGHEHGPDCGCPVREEGWGWRKEDDKDLEEGGADYRDDDDLDEAFFGGDDKERKKLASRPEFTATGAVEDDPGMVPPTAAGVEMAQTKKAGAWGKEVRGGRPVPKAKGSDVTAKDRSGRLKHLGTQTWRENKKISVREAKAITRRIIERIKKESK